MPQQNPLDAAFALVKKGHPDVAAVYFAAASQQCESSDDRFVARANASHLAERVAQATWGCTAGDFIGDPRQVAACEAIAAASSGGRRVLLLGSALGVYAAAAKEGGASRVLCCESSSFFEYIATAVVRSLELEDVEITTDKVSKVVASCKNQAFDVIVAVERFWGSKVVTQAVEEYASALPLLAASGVAMPVSVSVMAQGMESNALRVNNWLDVDLFRQDTDLDYAQYNVAARRSRLGCSLRLQSAFKAISAAQEWRLFELQCSDLGAWHLKQCERGDLELSIHADGCLDGVVTWSSVMLTPEEPPLAWCPGEIGETVWQYCHYPPQPPPDMKSVGEKVALSLCLDPTVSVVGWKTPGDAIELSGYHTSMLADDQQRLKAYRCGVEAAVQKIAAGSGEEQSAVPALDIGTGTGLLAMFAARAGADVAACERGPNTAALASQLVDANSQALCKGSVKVINALSTDLSVTPGDLPRPKLIVSEIFGTDPLSESVLPVLEQASKQFGGKEAGVAYLPCQCRVWGALAHVPEMWVSRTEDASLCGVDVGEFLTPFDSGTLLVDPRNEFRDIKLLSEPGVLVTHSLAPPIMISGESVARLNVLPQGPRPLYEMFDLDAPEVSLSSSHQLCLVLWWDADCSLEPCDDPETRISTSPAFARSSHWTQFVRILQSDYVDDEVEAALQAQRGKLEVRTKWKTDRMEFHVAACLD
eukprot:TRINITY_DN4134_c0_g1_i1.p1 TRINITY_DN4134_c0_g1~~TRINITY_DN4134_c0_g1_i1.p1  ORF type:complete len:727 (-),score=117.06 TRINITY_DN4134_c0_g1_i1:372-2489(-)